MEDALIIYVDRLGDGKEELLALSLSPSFMEIDEPDLRFSTPLAIKGKVYLAEQYLALHYEIHTSFLMRCSICNEWTLVPMDLPLSTCAIPVDELRSHLYDCSQMIREAVLLEIPSYVECGGNCPGRAELHQFLKGARPSRDESVRFPFTDLTYEEGNMSNGRS